MVIVLKKTCVGSLSCLHLVELEDVADGAGVTLLKTVETLRLLI